MIKSIGLTLAVVLGICGAAACSQNATAPAQSQSDVKAEISIKNATVRPPLPGRTTALGAMAITNNTSQDDALIAVSAPISKTVEIHTMLQEDGVMKMRRLENGLSIPAGQTVTLKGGADHLMMFETTVDQSTALVPLTLTFEKAGVLTVSASIDDGSGSMDHSAH